MNRVLLIYLVSLGLIAANSPVSAQIGGFTPDNPGPGCNQTHYIRCKNRCFTPIQAPTEPLCEDLFSSSPTCSDENKILSLKSGKFSALAAYADAAAGGGDAQLVVFKDGKTTVNVRVYGLQPDTAYPVHVHAGPCSANGLGHYKIDPGIATVVESNEIWPRFTTNDVGIGLGQTQVDHMARGDALSIVVHDPNNGNAKMLCADLLSDESELVTVSSGVFRPFASATDVDTEIKGDASLVRNYLNNSTTVMVNITGLEAEFMYMSHVHALPCDVLNAGGHYKIDPLVAEVIAENELWPRIVDYEDGIATDIYVEDTHLARSDAQSVVIHRRVDGSAPKVACADLKRKVVAASEVTTGSSVLFAAAYERGYEALKANASMTRALNGSTSVILNIEGAEASKSYPVHVHNLPCGVSNGGGHYKILPELPIVIESNEIWLNFVSDGAGEAKAEAIVNHLARSDAQSIVIHDGIDGVRLACIDLE